VGQQISPGHVAKVKVAGSRPASVASRQLSEFGETIDI
jgi:hypothetical protein